MWHGLGKERVVDVDILHFLETHLGNCLSQWVKSQFWHVLCSQFGFSHYALLFLAIEFLPFAIKQTNTKRLKTHKTTFETRIKKARRSTPFKKLWKRATQSKRCDLRFIESIMKSFTQLAEAWVTRHRRGKGQIEDAKLNKMVYCVGMLLTIYCRCSN